MTRVLHCLFLVLSFALVSLPALPADAAGTAQVCYRQPGRNVGDYGSLGSVLDDLGSCKLEWFAVDAEGEPTGAALVSHDDESPGNAGGLRRCIDYSTEQTSALVGASCSPLERVLVAQCDDDSGNKGPAVLFKHTFNAQAIPAVFAPNASVEVQVDPANTRFRYRETDSKDHNNHGLGTVDPLLICRMEALDTDTSPFTVVESVGISAGSVSGGNQKSGTFSASLTDVDLYRLTCETTGGVKSTTVESLGTELFSYPQAPSQIEVYAD